MLFIISRGQSACATKLMLLRPWLVVLTCCTPPISDSPTLYYINTTPIKPNTAHICIEYLYL